MEVNTVASNDHSDTILFKLGAPSLIEFHIKESDSLAVPVFVQTGSGKLQLR